LKFPVNVLQFFYLLKLVVKVPFKNKEELWNPPHTNLLVCKDFPTTTATPRVLRCKHTVVAFYCAAKSKKFFGKKFKFVKDV